MKAIGFFLLAFLFKSIGGVALADSTVGLAQTAPLRWLVLSPIPVQPAGNPQLPDEVTQKRVFATDLLAAQGGEAKISPQPGGKISVNGVEREWKATAAVADQISLNSAERKDDFEIAYASTEFEVPRDTDTLIGIGSDDAVRVWLNGDLIHEKWSSRGVQLDEDIVPVHLKAGKNRLLLKVQNISGPWGFACRLLDDNLKANRLVTAAKAGDITVLKELIGRGIDVNARATDGLTPYLAAHLWGRKSAAEFLAQQGADIHVAPPPPEKLVDAIMTKWATPDSPGAGIAIIQKGKVIFEKGYGLANLEYGVPVRPETVFHVASVSKQFTAMAIVLLEADGKLSIDDDVHKYLTELPDYGVKITLRQLLQHTSGIRDQWQTLALAGWNLQDVITQDQILRMLFRQKELNFPPGSMHNYSNGGFTLLAEVVGRVSGKPFPQFCAERIFIPLGMTHTHFHQDLSQLVPGRAYSYFKTAQGYAAAPLNYANVGATSLFTTAGDLVQWLDNFRSAKVGGAAGVARLQEPCVLTSGKKIEYGLGVSLADFRGQHTISHGGADAGYRSEVLWFPEQQWGVAVVGNAGNFNPYEVAREVAGVSLYEKLTPVDAKAEITVERKFITLAPQELEKFVGNYPLPQISQSLVVAAENGKLWAAGPIRPPLELRAVGPTNFYLPELQADIEFSPKGSTGMTVKIIQPGAVNEGERTESTGVVETDLGQYAGRYWSEELETQYTFFVRNGNLFGIHAHHGEFALHPTIKDQFSAEEWFAPEVKYFRDPSGKITGLTLGGGRVNAVKFTRK